MALSGRISGSVTLHGDFMSFYALWSAKQNKEANYSDVTVTTYWETSNIYWGFDTVSTRPASITINGATQSISQRFDVTDNQDSGWNVSNPYVIQTATQRVYHNNDGKMSLVISARANGGAGSYGPSASTNSYDDCTLSGTITLDDIPRASGLSVAPAVIGSPATITINKAVSAFTHTIQYSFSEQGQTVSGVVVEQTSESAVVWNVPVGLYDLIPAKKSIAGTLTCYTYNGSTLIGSTVTPVEAITTEDTCAPYLEPSVVDINSATVALTGNSNVMVKYASQASCVFNASARNGASLESLSVECGGASLQGDGVLSGVVSGVFVFVATDSRGYSSTVTIAKSLINYILPSCVIDSISLNGEGELSLTISGNCFTGSFGVYSNAIQVQYRYKPSGGSYTSWLSANSVSAQDNKYTATVLDAGNDYTQVYAVQARVLDKITNTSSNVSSVSAYPLFDWGTEDFNFNIPVRLPEGSTLAGKAFLDLCWPVGSVYLSLNATSPAALFGGTWTQIKDRFLLAAGDTYAVETTGGAAAVQLAENQMPRHYGHHSPYDSIEVTSGEAGENTYYIDWRSDGAQYGTERPYVLRAGNELVLRNFSRGSGQAHENMPPYTAVYVWKRVS